MEVDTASPVRRFVTPEIVATHFHIHPGDTVADFGVGVGYFIPTLSRLVGNEGRVYALEIQKNLLNSVSELCRAKNLTNVDVVWCDIEEDGGAKLRDGILDIGIVVNTLFQMEQRGAAFVEMARTLRSGGRLYVIDWSESFEGIGPSNEQVVSADEATALAESHGFVLERSFDAGDHHYGLAFQKP